MQFLPARRFVAIVGVVRRKQQFENQLLMNTWKVKWEDIEPLRSGKTKDGSTVRAGVQYLRTTCCIATLFKKC